MNLKVEQFQEEKLVSINVTTYNRADFLVRCLDSILEQSYRNIEVIVVDDYSQDHTEEVATAFCRRDQRVKYFKHDANKGNAYARNTALKHCRGYYVAFMDDDDEWIDPDKLKKQVAIFENSDNEKLGIVCSGVKVIDQQGKETIKEESRPKNLISVLLKGNGIIHNSTVLTKKAIMEQVGGFDVKMPRGVDSEFFRTVVVDYKYDVFFMEDITAAYYEHAHVRMTTNTEKAVLKTLKANFHVIKKHFFAYVTHPAALFDRVYTRTKKIISYYR